MPDPQGLEERFTRPPNWREGQFANIQTAHTIHYGTVLPEGNDPAAIVVILPGLSEFTEKYFETARDLLKRNLAVWVIDWAYQGRSTRFDKPMRRHSDGFDADVQDLHKLISDFVLPSANGKSLILLGHSMGGHLGLRYLATHPGVIRAAAFTAPMLGIKDVNALPKFLVSALLNIMKPFSLHYVPGGKDWHEAARKSDGGDIFSSDPVRDRLHNQWSLAYPELQVGNPTWRWLYEAVQSCNWLLPRLPQITTPLLLACAGRETIIDNKAIRRAVTLTPRMEMLELPDARHEIFMERDDIRNRWLQAFDKLLRTHDITRD